MIKTDKKAFALMLALWLLVGFSVAAMSAINVVGRRLDQYVIQVNSLKAGYLAESAKNYFLEYVLSFDNDLNSIDNVNKTIKMGADTLEFAISYADQTARSANMTLNGKFLVNGSPLVMRSISFSINKDVNGIELEAEASYPIIPNLKKYNALIKDPDPIAVADVCISKVCDVYYNASDCNLCDTNCCATCYNSSTCPTCPNSACCATCYNDTTCPYCPNSTCCYTCYNESTCADGTLACCDTSYNESTCFNGTLACCDTSYNESTCFNGTLACCDTSYNESTCFNGTLACCDTSYNSSNCTLGSSTCCDTSYNNFNCPDMINPTSCPANNDTCCANSDCICLDGVYYPAYPCCGDTALICPGRIAGGPILNYCNTTYWQAICGGGAYYDAPNQGKFILAGGKFHLAWAPPSCNDWYWEYTGPINTVCEGGWSRRCFQYKCEKFNCQRFNCQTFNCNTFNCQKFNCQRFNCQTFKCQTFKCQTFRCKTYRCSDWNSSKFFATSYFDSSSVSIVSAPGPNRTLWGQSSEAKNLYVAGDLNLTNLENDTYGVYGNAYVGGVLTNYNPSAIHNSTADCTTNPEECTFSVSKPALITTYFDNLLSKATLVPAGNLTIGTSSPYRQLKGRNIFVNGNVTISTTNISPLEGPGNIIATGTITTSSNSYLGDKIGLISATQVNIGYASYVGGTKETGSDFIKGKGLLIFVNRNSGLSVNLDYYSKTKAVILVPAATAGINSVNVGYYYNIDDPTWNVYAQFQGLIYTQEIEELIGNVYGYIYADSLKNNQIKMLRLLEDTITYSDGAVSVESERPLKIRGLYTTGITNVVYR
ncbi:MAG: hypothetical protein AB1629_05435 [Candidatus Omnitrophota bacterium]